MAESTGPVIPGALDARVQNLIADLQRQIDELRGAFQRRMPDCGTAVIAAPQILLEPPGIIQEIFRATCREWLELFEDYFMVMKITEDDPLRFTLVRMRTRGEALFWFNEFVWRRDTGELRVKDWSEFRTAFLRRGGIY